MKRHLFVAASVIFVGINLGANVSVEAQTPCASGRGLSAQERIARRDIQARINESIDADIARDAEAGTLI
jgi:hypothetical protein